MRILFASFAILSAAASCSQGKDSPATVDPSVTDQIIQEYQSREPEGMKREETDTSITITFRALFDRSYYISKLKKDYVCGDINKDGTEDMVVNVKSEKTPDGNYRALTLFLFFQENKNFKLGFIEETYHLSGCEYGWYQPLKIHPGKVSGISTCMGPDDRSCCPSLRYATTLLLQGKKLVVGEKKKIEN